MCIRDSSSRLLRGHAGNLHHGVIEPFAARRRKRADANHPPLLLAQHRRQLGKLAGPIGHPHCDAHAIGRQPQHQLEGVEQVDLGQDADDDFTIFDLSLIHI